ncbi:hypothetical protein K227x_05610 [Rubripirellula lacrimiformis]|uniref:Uncharacterized protein n=1 Tax=Rubripirellula lacrimiformis TaxID=1930273 RepID=A0A517N4X3_9BACT|nr:hypothetical protein [Rubripirellula lacrimiformis]QDT02189.1 hypothetical protein K227x_05610 [Rubripirellula lacrimiformis]
MSFDTTIALGEKAKTIRSETVQLSDTLHAADERNLSEQYPDDEGISKDERVIIASDFESGIDAPFKIARKGVVALQNDKIAFTGKGCVQITATRNVDQGGDVKIQWDKGVDTCFIRVYVRFDKDT